MTTIDVSDLDLYQLILELWDNMKPASFFNDAFFNAGFSLPSKPTRKQIDQTMDDGYIDYLAGRCIKTDFSDLTRVSTRLYNRDAGDGKFESIVAKLRQQS